MLAVVTILSLAPWSAGTQWLLSCDKVEEGICDIPESRSPWDRGSMGLRAEVTASHFHRGDQSLEALRHCFVCQRSTAICGLAIAGPVDSRHLTSTACPTGEYE